MTEEESRRKHPSNGVEEWEPGAVIPIDEFGDDDGEDDAYVAGEVDGQVSD